MVPNNIMKNTLTGEEKRSMGCPFFSRELKAVIPQIDPRDSLGRYLITYTLSVHAKNRIMYAYRVAEGSMPSAAHIFCNEKRKVLDFYEMLVYNLFIIKN